MAATATVEFQDIKVKYDSAATKRWSVQRRLATGGPGSYDAFDEVLMGHADEVAEKLGDDAEAMVDLLNAILEKESEAKN